MGVVFPGGGSHDGSLIRQKLLDELLGSLHVFIVSTSLSERHDAMGMGYSCLIGLYRLGGLYIAELAVKLMHGDVYMLSEVHGLRHRSFMSNLLMYMEIIVGKRLTVC